MFEIPVPGEKRPPPYPAQARLDPLGKVGHPCGPLLLRVPDRLPEVGTTSGSSPEKRSAAHRRRPDRQSAQRPLPSGARPGISWPRRRSSSGRSAVARSVTFQTATWRRFRALGPRRLSRSILSAADTLAATNRIAAAFVIAEKLGDVDHGDLLQKSSEGAETGARQVASCQQAKSRRAQAISTYCRQQGEEVATSLVACRTRWIATLKESTIRGSGRIRKKPRGRSDEPVDPLGQLCELLGTLYPEVRTLPLAALLPLEDPALAQCLGRPVEDLGGQQLPA